MVLLLDFHFIRDGLARHAFLKNNADRSFIGHQSTFRARGSKASAMGITALADGQKNATENLINIH